MKSKNAFLLLGGLGSLAICLLHVCIVMGGPDWYRFFGAGEEMAQMAEKGSIYPAILTLGIAGMFALWAGYAFSGAGVIGRLPLPKVVLSAISAIYLLRGVGGIPMIFLSPTPHSHELSERMAFMLATSILSLALGVLHAVGMKQSWPLLARKST